MIIQRLDLKAFGRFTDVSLDLSAGPRRFHLVYGPNESGKTTSLRAITSLLFGMPHRTDDNYLHNNSQMRVGGLLVDRDGTELECVRRRGRKGTLRDADDDQPLDDSLMAAMLGGIDQETFLARFGLSHQELVEGGKAIIAGEGDLGQILFAAGAGVSGLREIQSQLVEERDRLFVPRGNRAINQTIKGLEENRTQLRGLQLQPTAFMDLRDRLRQKRECAAELHDVVQRHTVYLGCLRAQEQAIPLLPQWRKDQQELAELFDVPVLDEGFSERRRDAESQREVAAKLCESLTERIAELTEQLDSMPVDASVLENESEIESLFQELATRDKADRDRADLIRVRRNLDRKIIDVLDELSFRVTREDLESTDVVDDVIQKLRVSDAMRARIHELAANHEKLIHQRDDTSERLTTLQRKLGDANAQLRQQGQPEDPVTLISLLDEIGSPASLLDALEQHSAESQRLREQSEEHLRNLIGFGGDCRAAARLQIPQSASLARIGKEIADADNSVRLLKEKLVSAQRDRDQLNRQLIADRHGDPLPTMLELRAARQRRDRVLELMRGSESKQEREALLDQLQSEIVAADATADTIQLHHQQVHQRSVDEKRLIGIDQEVTDLEDRIEAAIGALDAAQDNWKALWNSCDVTAGSPQQMEHWIQDHRQLVASFKQWEAEELRCDQVRQRIDRATTRLRSALDPTQVSRTVAVGSGFTQTELFEDQPSVDNLDALYDEAVTLRSTLAEKRHEYETLRRRCDEWSEEIPLVKTRLEKYQRDIDQWRDDWNRITEAFPDAQKSTPGVVVSMLSRIDDLCAKKRERDILTSRVRSMGEDDDKFDRRVQRLAVALEIKSDQPVDPGATVRIMFSRLQSERANTGRRASVSGEIQQANQRLAESKGKREQSEFVLQQLCAEVGGVQAEQLPEIERRSRKRARVESSLRDLENQLGILAGDESMEDFIQSAQSQQPALLADQIQQQQKDLADAKGLLSEVEREVGALQHELDLMNGSGRAAELHQENQFLLGKLDHDSRQYARLRIASMIMQRAIDHYRRENQNPVLTYAQEMFCELTGGEYATLKVDYDARGKSILFGERKVGGDGTLVDVPVSLMSVGTADALYLALRLASLKHQLQHGQPVPVVIDDCLIQLDDDRAVAAMKILSKLSETTQVILFTHHRHLLDLAQRNLEVGDYHVQRL